MNPAETAIIVLLATLLFAILIGIIMYFCLDNKYRYFYTETDQGYDLLKLLNEKDKILSKEQFLTIRGADLRKMVDDRRKYYILNSAVAFELDSLRSDYMEVVAEYEELMQQKNSCQKAIDELVYNLPKKYQDAINYNWRQFKE